ncbi:MAG: hypothetical protein N3E41_08965 [Thermofilaceae archaeon]|nr:hypothetical protein [Thermofilaceae archaeon]
MHGIIAAFLAAKAFFQFFPSCCGILHRLNPYNPPLQLSILSQLL